MVPKQFIISVELNLKIRYVGKQVERAYSTLSLLSSRRFST